MKLVSWNVNGMRSVWNKGFKNFVNDFSPDVICLQETKVNEDQLTDEQKNIPGYSSYWFSAEKPGYSGVAIFTKKEPVGLYNGIGVESIDREGRVMAVDLKTCVLVNAYFPNSQREHTRLPYKLEFCEKMHDLTKRLVAKGKNVVVCGDYNIAHKEIDLKNPKTNTKNAGFLPEERAWMDTFLGSGFVDGFRQFEQGHDHYTWWSYRPGVREKNVGWRIDYHCYNKEFSDRVKESKILSKVMGSDHCPIVLTLAD